MVNFNKDDFELADLKRKQRFYIIRHTYFCIKNFVKRYNQGFMFISLGVCIGLIAGNLYPYLNNLIDSFFIDWNLGAKCFIYGYLIIVYFSLLQTVYNILFTKDLKKEDEKEECKQLIKKQLKRFLRLTVILIIGLIFIKFAPQLDLGVEEPEPIEDEAIDGMNSAEITIMVIEKALRIASPILIILTVCSFVMAGLVRITRGD